MSLRQITKLSNTGNAVRTLVTSSIKNNNLSKTTDLPKLEKVYNTIKNLNEDDYRIFLHANVYSTKNYHDDYNSLLYNLKQKIDILKN